MYGGSSKAATKGYIPADMPKYQRGNHIHAKGYPRISAGPMRDQLVHRLVAAALIGRDLDKSEEVHHRDGNRLNCHWSNLMVMGGKDHGWVSAKQAWFMRERDRKEKLEWDAWMSEKNDEFVAEVREAKANGEPWQSGRVDGGMQAEWEAMHSVTEVTNGRRE